MFPLTRSSAPAPDDTCALPNAPARITPAAHLTRFHSFARLSSEACIRVSLAVWLSTLSFAASAQAPVSVELKLSTALGPAYRQGKAGAAWATLIRDRSSGRLAVKFAPGATLVGRDPAREFPAIRDGSIDLAVGSAGVWSTDVPQLNVFALPWLVADRAAMSTLVASKLTSMLAQRLDAAGVIVLAWCANDFVALATKSAVHGPPDLAGLRIRTRASPILVDTLVALGAHPSDASYAQARAAIAEGTLDGEETSPQAYVASQSSAAGLSHLLLWEAHADALVFAVNRARWASWSEADRVLVRDAAQDAARAECAAETDAAAEAALAPLARGGAVVTRLTAAGKAAFREAARGVYAKYMPRVGEDIVEAARAALHTDAPVPSESDATPHPAAH
jgi:TRAP-type transport system periplasmic protein